MGAGNRRRGYGLQRGCLFSCVALRKSSNPELDASPRKRPTALTRHLTGGALSLRFTSVDLVDSWSTSHEIERTSRVGEAVGFDAESLKHGDKQIRQRDFLLVVIEKLAVPEAHVAAATQDDGVVGGLVGLAGGTAIKTQRVV